MGITAEELEAVAEAVCRVDNPHREEDDPDGQPADAYEWDIKARMASEDGDYYRRMAQAAVDALNGFHCASCDGHACDEFS